MKKTTIYQLLKFVGILFICLPLFSFAQIHIEKDTLFINDSVRIVKGQYITLGEGSNMATRDFNFIYTKPNVLTLQEFKLGASNAGMRMLVKNIKVWKSRRRGTKYYLILGGGNIVNYFCDIIPAISTKEVILK